MAMVVFTCPVGLMPYLNLDLDYFDHPKTRRLIGLLGKGSEVIPIRVWAYVGKYHARDGKLAGYSAQEIESIVGWWGKEGELVEALLKVGFLRNNGDGFYVHDWIDHEGHIVAYKEKAQMMANARWGRESLQELCNAPSNALSNAITKPTIPTKLNNKKEVAETKIDFCWNTFKFLNVDSKKKAILKDKFPSVDIEKELKKMEAWLMANPKNRKSNYARFIVNWLSKNQDRSKKDDYL